MLVIITILVLILTGLALVLVRLLRPQFSYGWLIALGGALVAWVSGFFWQLQMPFSVRLTSWQPESLLVNSPILVVDGISFVLAASLLAVCLATILSAPLRVMPVNPFIMAGTLMLSALGLVAVMAGNPLTMVIAWSALDMAEFATMLRTFNRPTQSENAVVSFSVRMAGTGLVLWASAQSSGLGAPLNFLAIPPQAGIFLLVGAALRLGILPLHLPYRDEPNLRRGYGTVLRLVSAASSLALLARIPVNAIDVNLVTWFYLVTIIAALYGSWRWFRAEDELSGRPFWLIGMGSLAIASTLRGNPVGAAGWGAALVLIGGITFLCSARSRVLTFIILTAGLSLSALPFSLTATGWLTASLGVPWWQITLMVPAQVLLIAGFARFVSQPGDSTLGEYPRWVQIVYTAALVILSALSIALGLWGWDGAMIAGAWIPALVAFALAASLSLARLRLKILMGEEKYIPEKTAVQRLAPARILGNIFWGLYRAMRQISSLIAATLEGDGGVLWTLLLLVLLVTLIQEVR